MEELKVGIIGVGNMGLALMRGMLDSGLIKPQNLWITNRRKKRSETIAADYGVQIAQSNSDCAKRADVVLLAVKPQLFPKVLAEVGPSIDDQLVVSVAAGISIAQMEAAFPANARVIRAMPNTPALIKQAATAIASGAHATEEDMERAETIFSKIGIVRTVEEYQLDAITGLCGSGPAYIFLIIEAFADAGVKVGLSREIATELAVQTLQGSARLLQETREHPGKLKDQVTSPGGTAIAGLHTLEEGGLRTTIMNAVEAATLRARELGKVSGD